MDIKNTEQRQLSTAATILWKQRQKTAKNYKKRSEIKGIAQGVENTLEEQQASKEI